MDKEAGTPTMYDSIQEGPDGVRVVPEAPESVSRIAHEMDALQASMRVADGYHNDQGEALILCRTYLARLVAQTIEQYVIEGALHRILDRPVENVWLDIPSEPREDLTAATVALSWLSWAAGDSVRAISLLKSVDFKRRSKAGAIHLQTLDFWSQAVTSLIEGNRPAARRLFKRAIEMGSQFGTESHPMISWAYAASFFTSAK